MNEPSTFVNPRSFCPERFLDNTKPSSEAENDLRVSGDGTDTNVSGDSDPFEVVYGFGRR